MSDVQELRMQIVRILSQIQALRYALAEAKSALSRAQSEAPLDREGGEE